MSLFCSLDQLGGNAHAVSTAPNAPLQQIAHTQFPGNLRGSLLGVFVSYSRGSCDHSELGGLELAELGNHFLRKTIGKVILVRVPAQIYKGKDRQHGSLRRGVAWWPEMTPYQNPRRGQHR